MRKKSISAAVVTMALAAALISPASAACYGAATVTGNTVNVRSNASTSSEVQGTANAGDVVIIEGNSNGFHKVVLNGKEGWIADQYLSYMNDADGNFGTAYVTGSDVNVRSTPSTDGSVVTTCPAGTAVQVIGVSGRWYKVSVNGSQGYILGKYVSYTGAPASSSTAAASTSSSSGSDTQYRYVSGSEVRMRSGPSTASEILGVFAAGTKAILNSASNGWANITIDGLTGYMSASYMCYSPEGVKTTSSSSSTANKTGYIKGTSVRLRSAPSTDSQILGNYNTGKEITISGTEGSWTNAIVDGLTGYISSTYVTETRPDTTTKTAATSSSSSLGQQIADTACTYVGYPYVYGGSDPSGFDCSGFVKYIYGLYGYNLNRTAEQQASNGTAVDRSNLQPGDIICFSYGSGYIGHVGIYIGNGQFVHAQSSSTGVVITDLNNSSYNNRVAACRRIVS